MTMRDAATGYVVERCPSCGVEHDRPVRECEACGGPVRYWCRAHGRETGWLDGPACARCAEEAARPASRPRPSVALPGPDVSRAIAPAAAVSAPAPAAAVPAPAAPAPRGGVTMDAAELARTPDDFWGKLFVLFFIVLTAVGGGALGGAVLGIPWVLIASGDTAATLRNFAVGGGTVGLLFGVYSFRIYLAEERAKRRAE